MLQLSPPRTTLSLGRMPPMVYLRIVEHGSNYKLFDRDLLWKFLSVGRSSKWLHAGRPSCTWTTSFRCTHRLNPNCNSEHLIYQVDDLSGLGQHDERTGDTPMFFLVHHQFLINWSSYKYNLLQMKCIYVDMQNCKYEVFSKNALNVSLPKASIYIWNVSFVMNSNLFLTTDIFYSRVYVE